MGDSNETATSRRDMLKLMSATGMTAILAGAAAIVGGTPKTARAQGGGFELPNYNEDPPYIEGPNGGAATPFNGHPHQGHDGVKDDTGDISGFLDQAASIANTAGKILTTVGAANLGGSLATAGTILQIASNMMELITGDPPKPYEELVQFSPRDSKPRGMGNPIGAKIGLISQHGVFTTVTAKGCLDALERRKGALLAGDYTWAMVHTGVFVAAREQMAVNLAHMSAGIYATSQAIKGTQHDVDIDAGKQSEVLAWLGGASVAGDIAQQCREAGLNDDEVNVGLGRIKSAAHFKGLPDAPTSVSQSMANNAKEIHARAKTMHKRASDVKPFW